MTPQEIAEKLVNQYRIVLMREDTECGNEILCTIIAKDCALIAVDEIIMSTNYYPEIKSEERDGKIFIWVENVSDEIKYWHEVKKEIEKL